MQENSKQPGLSWSAPQSAPASAAAEPRASAPASKPAPAPSSLEVLGDKKTLQTQAPVYTGLLVGGIIIGVLLSTVLGSPKREGASVATSTPQTANAASVAASASTVSSTEAPLVVLDQPAGSSVAISKLSIAKPTWVVVYVSREGKPGNALGARLFFAGDKQGKVGLLRDTARGQNYFVGLSVDNGDRVFSLSADKPLADADGGALWASFTAR